MGERERHTHGTFSFVDLATSNVDAAKASYSDLFGWDYDDRPMPEGGDYSMAMLGGRVAAAMSAPMDPAQPSAWNSYVTVDDVDAAAGKAGELGGNVVMPPFDVMEAGRMALIQDPTGAFFSAWQAGESIGSEIVNVHGAFTMNQLNTPEPERAREFYEGLFGWRFEEVEGAPMPFWSIYLGDRLNGAMMLMPPDTGAPAHWLVYFAVDDLDAASEKIGGAGGSIMVEKTAVPAGEFVVAQDAQGAVFGLFAGEFDD